MDLELLSLTLGSSSLGTGLLVLRERVAPVFFQIPKWFIPLRTGLGPARDNEVLPKTTRQRGQEVIIVIPARTPWRGGKS